MRKAAEGHLTTEALMWNQNNQKTISGMSSEDFRFVSRAVFPFLYPCQGWFTGVIIFYLGALFFAELKIGNFSPNSYERMKEKRDKIIKYFPIH